MDVARALSTMLEQGVVLPEMDSFGNWIGRFATKVGVCTAFEAEVCAIIHDLRFAWEKGARQLEVEIDSLQVFHWVTERTQIQRFSNLLVVCKNLLSLPWRIEFKHILRESNTVVDALASYALQEQDKGLTDFWHHLQHVLHRTWCAIMAHGFSFTLWLIFLVFRMSPSPFCSENKQT